jgi:hypothetical protein
VGHDGAPVTVSHHPAAQQLQQAMQQGAQSVMGSLSQAGQQVAAAMSVASASHMRLHEMEPELFTRWAFQLGARLGWGLPPVEEGLFPLFREPPFFSPFLFFPVEQ